MGLSALAIVLWVIGIAAVPDPAAAPERGPEEPPPLRIAVTVDDLPVAQPSWHPIAVQECITGDLLATFARHGVRAVGFVNADKLEVDGVVQPRRVALLERWLAAGHELGNHGYSHLSLHRVDPDVWIADAVRGEAVVRGLVERSGGTWRWFRHPFLHAGRSAEVQRSTAEALAARGYTVAPVTIDNGEWVYGFAYAEALNAGDEAAMRRLGDDYVRYMLDIVEYWREQGQVVLGRRDLPHVLLIHAYALNADRLDELLTALQARGAEWITLQEALKDPAYERPIHGWTGMGGISWLHRWAITAGVDRELLRGEPEVPAWVEALRE